MLRNQNYHTCRQKFMRISERNQAFRPLITTVKLRRFLSSIFFHLDFKIRKEHWIHAVKRQRTAGHK